MANMELAHYNSLQKWKPQVGDFIIWHGWFQHYFGVVSSVNVNDNSIDIIKKGLPLLLFEMVPEEHNKNKIKADIGNIKNSGGGKYAAIRANNNNVVWYV